MSLPRVSSVLGLLLTVVMLAPSVTHAEPLLTLLEWTHPDPSTVARYEVRYAFTLDEQSKPTAVNVEKPEWGDHFAWTISVPEQASVWVSVVAIGTNDLPSEPTPWRRYDWKPGQGPLATSGQPYLVSD